MDKKRLTVNFESFEWILSNVLKSKNNQLQYNMKHKQWHKCHDGYNTRELRKSKLLLRSLKKILCTLFIYHFTTRLLCKQVSVQLGSRAADSLHSVGW